MKKQINELRNITRLDQDFEEGRRRGTHGWWVRFTLGDKIYSQLFSDNKFGSKEKALQAAKIYRDALEREIRPKQIQHTPNLLSRRNRSGIVGVNRSKRTEKKRGKVYVYYVWQAHWPTPEGQRVNRSFSINKYGEEGARRKAIQARLDGLAELSEHAASVVTPVFNPPQDQKSKIWRYMDFTKLISILEKNSLYFPLISELNDPFEGSYSIGNKQFRPLIYKHLKPRKDLGALVRELRSWVAVSCWHMSEHESAAMWNLYSKSDEAICIQTTYNLLKSALGGDIEIGTVQYVDYEKDWIPEDHPLIPFLYKRKSFEHEAEIRAIINLSSVESLSIDSIKGKPPDCGVYKEVDLNKLVRAIHIAPNSAPWFYNLVQNVSKTYGLNNVKVIQSSLEKEPFY